MKKKLCFAMLCLGLLLGFAQPQTAYAAEKMQWNVNAHDYSVWSDSINDYLVKCSNGRYMSVVGSGKGLYVQYYDNAFNVVSAYSIPAELPKFGAFYEDENYYYVLSGQDNPEESDSVEVYRITKYDKTWNRIGAVSIYGADTSVPFRAGTARVAHHGNYLFVRTDHEMYKSSDGLNHQSNFTIMIDKEKMELITTSEAGERNFYYVSHSLNQFIKFDGDVMLALDHGDGGNTRSLCLTKNLNIFKPNREIDYKEYSSYWSENWSTRSNNELAVLDVYDLYEATEDQNYNRTGASVGGFEFSDTNYLVAANSVIQDADWYDRWTRNIFVGVVDKESGEVTINWITDFAEGEASASTPHLVKLDNNSFVLLWTRDGAVNYVKLNGNGQPVGQIYQFEGALSECEPIVADGKLTWYVYDYYALNFYQIDLSNFANVSRTQSGVGAVQMPTQTTESAYSLAKITGVYIPENDGRQIRAGAIINTSAIDITYECTVIDYDYAKWGTSFFPETKRTTDKNDNWMVYTPSHPGMYGFCWRAYDAQGNLLSEYGATHYFAGNTVSNVGIYVPDRNAQTLDFGMIFDSPDKDNVRITWFLYRPDDNVYEAILSDGLVSEKGVVQQWTKKPGRYWIMCRVTAANNPESSLCWGVEVRDGVVIDPQ